MTAASDGNGVLIDSNGQVGTIGNVTFSNNLGLPATAPGGTAGVITLGGEPFIHDFGSQNTFVGTNAGNFAMTGSNNTGSGFRALFSTTTGFSNTASGNDTLFNNTTGSGNTANGDDVLFTNTTGGHNTAVGRDALFNNTVGSFNIGIGYIGGFNLTDGDLNIDIGNSGVAGEANTIRIGTEGNHSRTFIAAVRGRTTGAADAVPVVIDSNGQLGTTSSSIRYKFDVADMGHSTDRLMKLRPVMFRYLAHQPNAPLQYGLIAEEVAKVYPELVAYGKDGRSETVMYQFLAPMLLNEVQKQRQENAALRERLERLERIVQKLTGETSQ